MRAFKSERVRRLQSTPAGRQQLRQMLEDGAYSVLNTPRFGDTPLRTDPRLTATMHAPPVAEADSARRCLQSLAAAATGTWNARMAFGFVVLAPALSLRAYHWSWSSPFVHAAALFVLALATWALTELNAIGLGSKRWLLEMFVQGFLPRQELDAALGTAKAWDREVLCQAHATRLLQWSMATTGLAAVQGVRLFFS